MLRYLSIFLVTLFLLLFSNTVFSAIKLVSSTNDFYSPGELRYEIDFANANDTIVINVSGTVMLNASINVSSSIVIVGPEAIHFIVDASGAGGPAFNFSAPSIYLTGIKVINGVSQAIDILSGNALVNRCVFNNNNGGNGGAIHNTATVKFESCSFMSNNATTGGAIYNDNGIADFFNCTFYANQSTSQGGVIYNFGASILSLVNNTFYNNNAGSTGTIQSFNGNVFVQNNIFNGNTQGGGEVLNAASGAVYNSGGRNVFSNASVPFVISGQATELTGVNPQLSATMIVDGFGLEYFSLQPGSPCIDFGNNSGLTKYDARRVWRIMDASGVVPTVDAGAVEYSPFTVNSTGSSGAGTFNQAMIDVGGALYSGRKAIVFEHAGVGPHNTFSSVMNSVNEPFLIINGFSQNLSQIPGPEDNIGILTPAYTSVVFDGGSSANPFLDIMGGADSVVVTGVSIMNYFVGISTYAGSTIIEGCHIGVDATGLTTGPNTIGIQIPSGGFGGALIGTKQYLWTGLLQARNVISGNMNAQIEIINCTDNSIEGNFIGPSADGVTMPTPLNVGNVGINILGGPLIINYNNIGGYAYGQQNVIAGQNEGIHTELSSTFIVNNFIGTNYYGYPSLNPSNFSLQRGIVVDGGAGSAYYNYIEENVIGNTLNAGVNLTNASSNTYVIDNYIGLADDGITPIVNSGEGILVNFDSYNNVIGGVDALDGNFICYSNAPGISYQNMSVPCNDSIMGNYIGLDILFNAAPNLVGIFADVGTKDLFIGNIIPGYGNQIAYNIADGVQTPSSSIVNGIRISGNSMYSNGGNGIDLDSDGYSITTGTAPISNNGQIPPNLLNLSTCSGNTFSTIKYSVSFLVGNPYEIEFFLANIDGEEGDTYLGTMSINPTLTTETYSFDIPGVALGAGDIVTATATATNFVGPYHTSEFSDTILFNSSGLSVNVGADLTICPGDPIVMTASVTGASGSETYTWSNSQNTATMSDVPLGSPTTYFVDVADGGCIASDTVIISHFTYPGFTFVGDDSTCVGEVLSYSIDAGNSAYNWSVITQGGSVITASTTNTETVTFNGVGNDTLWVNIQDINACWWSEKFPIEVFALPFTTAPTTSSTTVCENQTGVVYSTSFTAGNTYNWSITGGAIVAGMGTSSIIVDWDIPGVYTLSVSETNSGGCTSTPETLLITVNPSPTATDQTGSYCSDVSGGTIATIDLATDFDDAVNGASGNPVTWFTDANLISPILITNAHPAVNGATVYAYVSNGACGDTATVTIAVTSSPAANAGADTSLCGNNANIILAGLVNGAIGGSWSTSGTGTFTPSNTTLNATYVPSALDISSGGVSLTLSTTGNGSCLVHLDNMVLTITPAPTVNAGADTTICGGGNALLSASITVATGVTWTGGTGTFTNPSLLNTTYIPSAGESLGGTVTLTATTSGNGSCSPESSSMILTITAPPLTSTITGPAAVCVNDVGVVFSVSPTAGSTYSWNIPAGNTITSGQGTNSINVDFTSIGGAIFVTETNAGGCVGASVTHIVTNNPLPTVTASPNATLCDGSPLGVLGAGASTYVWDNGVTDGVSFQPPVGITTYTVTGTDGNGCQNTATSTITVNPNPTITVAFTDISCNGLNDGTITVTTTGGTSPYQYSIDGGIIYNLGADPYTYLGLSGATNSLYVMDANNCVSNNILQTIIDPPAIIFDTIISVDESCLGNDGTITVVNASGGVPLLGYSADGGATYQAANFFASLAPGTYPMMLNDQNGCTLDMGTVTLSSTPPVLISTNSFTDVTCFGFTDGTITSNLASGGSGTYSYQWYSVSNGIIGGQTTLTGNTLPAGDFYIQVTDGTCIQNSDTVTILEPNQIMLGVSVADPTCSNTTNGSIVIEVTSGGISPFSYSVDNGTTTSSGANPFTFNNLVAGPTYTPYVIDVGGCVATDISVTLTNPTPVTANVVVTNISCFGSADGQFDVIIAGGITPYTLSTDGGANFSAISSNPEIINATVGNFTIDVTAMDGNGCTSDTNTYIVLEPAQISYNVTVTPDTCTQGIGTIIMTNVTGGTGGPYGYTINGIGGIQIFNNVFNNVSEGSYNVVVGDGNNCIKLTPFVVVSDVIGELTNAGTNGPYIVCPGESKYITAYGGTSYDWLTPGVSDPFSDSTEVKPDSTTTFSVEITSGGCMKLDSTTVTVDANGCALGEIANNVFSPDGDGINDFFILDIQYTLDNENTVYIYNRWGDLVREFTNYNNDDVAWDGNNRDGSPVPAGTYFYVVEISSINYSNSGWVQVVR